MTVMGPHRRRAAWTTAVALVLASCAGSSGAPNVGEARTATIASVEVTAAQTVVVDAADSSIAAPPGATSTTCTGQPVPVPTSPQPKVVVLDSATLLRADGFGPFDFGAARGEVVRAFEQRFGPQQFGDTEEYLRINDDGGCMDDIGVDTFPYPYGESVCTTFAICLQFGGPTPDQTVLVGWWLASGDGEALEITTTDGLGVGSTLANFAAIELIQPCRLSTGGRFGDFDLTMLVSEGSFGTPADPPTNPPPANKVVVDSITAGASVGGREEVVFTCR